jgi:hypothetical protein
MFRKLRGDALTEDGIARRHHAVEGARAPIFEGLSLAEVLILDRRVLHRSWAPREHSSLIARMEGVDENRDAAKGYARSTGTFTEPRNNLLFALSCEPGLDNPG